jgi:hypothetical protein
MMRLTLALLLALPAAAPAQTLVRISAGVTASSHLVKDFLGGPITVEQAVPLPTVALQLSHTLPSGYRLGVEGRLTSGTTKVSDNGTTEDLGTVRALSVMALADGPIRGALRWQAGVGSILYRPIEETGIWSRGGASRWLVGGGLTWTRPLGSVDLVVGGRYDFHPFTTPRLDDDGYAGYQAVHRVGLTLGLERGF